MSLNEIPLNYRDLLEDEKRAFLDLATTMPDGSPQVTPVWFNHDGDTLLINSAKGRVKDHNMRTHPEVACLIVDPDNPYRYVQIMGRVEEIVEDKAVAEKHINDLNEKYHGKRGYPIGDAERVQYRIRPEQISTMG
jgi:PPOX class probable F420-dependent enzyme